MNRNKTILKAVEKFRKQIDDDLPKDLVAAIIEVQATNGGDPTACLRGIRDLITQHLEESGND